MTTESTFLDRKPRSLREGYSTNVICQHRDLSCCGVCAKKYGANIVEVYGQHYWAHTIEEYNQLIEALAEEIA